MNTVKTGLLGWISILLLVSCENQAVQEAVDKKVDSLLAKMTLEEKIGQLVQISGNGYNEGIVNEIKNGNITSILNETDPKIVNALQKVAVEESRLGIPILFGRDVIHGFKTIFPVPLGQAASWNPQLVEEGSRIAAIEASSAGIRWTFAPMLDIARDQRWGRIVEGFGEDPYLTSVLGAASVKGFQGDRPDDPTSIAACAKHFAGYGAAEGGRDYNTAQLSTEQLRNTYLPPFKAAVEAGVETVMTSFNEINGVPSSGNSYLLRNVLRSGWGFKGTVVSDWNSAGEMIQHGYAVDGKDAAKIALKAGVDMDMENHLYLAFLKQLLEQGEIKEADIDQAVSRVLRLKYRLGLFDHPYTAIKESVLYAEEHLQKAREAAIQGVVLLKNEKNRLPLSAGVKSVAVIGPLADAPHDQMGTWVFDGEKSHTVTPLASLRQEYGSLLKIHTRRDYNSVAIQIKKDLPPH